jgi:hypothetical protein
MVIALFSFSSMSIGALSEGGDGRRPNLLPDLLLDDSSTGVRLE